MNNEQEYVKLWHNAYGVAMHILRNSTDAEDIAQTCTIKYYLKKDEIENPQAWINRTAHNEAIDYAKRRNISLGDMKKIDYLQYHNSSKQEDIIGIEAVNLKEAKELLTEADYKIYKLILKYGKDTEKIAKNLEKSVRYAYNACYKMKKNLSAAKYLKEGYCGSKKIVNYYLHRKIIKFIQQLIKKMKENRLAEMHNYFRKIDTDKIPHLDIVEIFPYNIHLLADGGYDIYIPYKNSQGIINCCFLDFKLNKFNEIVVTKFYTQPPVKLESDDVTLMDEFRVKRKGLIVKSKKEAEKIFNSQEDNT